MATSGSGVEVPSLTLEVHQVAKLAMTTCNTLIIPISKEFHQCPLLNEYMKESGELKKIMPSIVQNIKSEKISTFRDEKLDKYFLFVPIFFARNKIKFALAGGMLSANLNKVKKLGIIYPGPFFCTSDFADSFYYCLFVKFMEKVLKEKQSISLEEIRIFVQDDGIFESLQNELIDVGAKVLLEKRDAIDMVMENENEMEVFKCTNCGEEMIIGGRLCKECLDSYPPDPSPIFTPKFVPTDDTKKKTTGSAPTKVSKEKEAVSLLADSVRYVREDFRMKFADHHLDKLVAEKLHSFIRLKLNVSSERIRKYLTFWLVGYKAGSFVGGCIPTMGMVPNPVCRLTCGVGLGSVICGCVGCHELLVKLIKPDS